MDETTTAAKPYPRRRIGLMTAAVLAALIVGNTATVATARADDSQEQMVHLADGDIHVVSSGAPNARAVVLLHGLAGSTAWWDPVMPALRNQYVVRIDLLGHGRSAKPDNGYSMAEQARRVGAVLDQLGVRDAIVVGHSTGGYVATSLAEQRHDLVTAIALIDTGSRLDAFTDNGPAGTLLSIPAIGQPLWPLLPDAAIRAALSTAFTRDVHIPDQIVADVRGMTYRSLTATSDASDTYLRDRTEPDRLTDVALPTMVLFGSEDRRWQPSSFDDYRRVPQVQIETLDCGHTPMIEEPDPTGTLIRNFADHH
ncbi:MAG: alpha/beta hydrolase family protein [Nocardia sp.]|uniref:alpha/beta fold hydrolase n=1 Tax=Nocardia sp. TaxID=1821 RepID=UPI00262560BF|nr:alpha/beta hydrolase [Nocardia sp.]MCU1647720.1 alpha/beta hydrolase family protein [Nocardia sp.]